MILLKPANDTAVVIPTANDDERLSICLEGWLRQEDRSFAIHLVNDGGTEHTLEVAETYRKRGLTIHYHYLEGGGYRPASARNLGISKAEYATRIILSDGDVIPCNRVVSEHKKYGKQKSYVLGMRRRIPRLIAENVIAPQFRTGRLNLAKIEKYPWIRDQRLNDPMFKGMFTHLLNGTEPTPDSLGAFGEYFGVTLDQLPNGLWKALLCWSFNVSFSGSGMRMNPKFDRNYGFEDLEFGLRMITAGYKVVVNKKIVVYHLDHKPRATDDIKQYHTFKQTLDSILADIRK